MCSQACLPQEYGSSVSQHQPFHSAQVKMITCIKKHYPAKLTHIRKQEMCHVLYGDDNIHL